MVCTNKEAGIMPKTASQREKRRNIGNIEKNRDFFGKLQMKTGKFRVPGTLGRQCRGFLRPRGELF
jgi:hypothetical protein